jgi:ribosome maturation factor RimP
MNSLQTDIEARLAESAPDVEVLLAEVLGGHTVRLFIDHPEASPSALCERVTHLLPEVREHYALEVSSPGGHAPAHQGPPLPSLSSVGAHACACATPTTATSSFTGELVGATEARSRIAVDQRRRSRSRTADIRNPTSSRSSRHVARDPGTP